MSDPAAPAGYPQYPQAGDPYAGPAQPVGDPYAGPGGDPYAMPAQPGGNPYAAAGDPYAAPGAQPGPGAYAAPVGQPGGDPYAMGGHPPAGYPPPGYAAYPYPPVRRTNSMALAALILSLVGIASCVTAPVGAILGHVARKQIRETGEDGESMAKAAIIVGWVLTGLLVLAIVFYVVVIVFAISQGADSTY
ncbi:DUF4190 domain-containing protein [Micromonospora sp. WMMD882]|uniref:DUF4190 domain-containing protein n=1 Tax=Micromonospora sp. WMMD882 TaxID=3015151 RepID=UPI00248B6616|nr:DUF4190 domain-containing protein [Micromonospora sp. WMMD882]WBB82414.1 DUF4190 domain-containing protein [Micromonospora sp. WMMD882]